MAEENPFARLFSVRPDGTIATLARLAPGRSTDKIEIELTTADPKTVSYQCISYDRSREQEKKDITVDGQAMPVPLPLEQALRSFRHATEPVLLWADLLTGESPQERSKQALVMKEVIQNALAVTCFLGVGSERSTKAYTVLQMLANWWTQAAVTANFPSKFSMATHRNIEDMRALLYSRNLSDISISDEQLWLEINATLSSSYFTSTQALTDIVLGKEVLLRSGTALISWDNFNKAFRALLFILPSAGKEIPESVQDAYKLVTSIDVSVRRRRKGESLEMLPMIQSACQGTVSADPREFIFAILPIIDPSERIKVLGRKPEPLLTADYTKTTDQVFIEAAKYIIDERQDLLMWWNERPPCCKKIRSLPSWVPDWSASNSKPPMVHSLNNGLRKWWDSVTSPKRIFVDGDQALHVQAHALDRVDYVSPIFTRENYRRLCLDTWKRAKRIPGETKAQTVDKFWRAVVLDTDQDFGERMRDNVKPSSDMWLSLQSLISEEMILQTLDCTMHELATTPSLQAGARADEACADLGTLTGQSGPIENLILRNSLGRRMFQCRSGRMGMTATEGAASQSDTSADAPGMGIPGSDSDDPLSSMLRTTMTDAFQAFLAQRDPAAARVASQIFRGQSPGQFASGVRSGDIVAILVGGFQPYILRPVRPEAGASELLAEAKYVFVGDCHLQGAMDGECLLDSNGGWKRVPLVDISIV